MKNIPIRHINNNTDDPNFSENFIIRDVQKLLGGKDMVQELHRHDYFHILVLKHGAGSHEIDFVRYRIRNHSVFFMRPGQVHELILKGKSSGYLLQFKTDFYPYDKASRVLLRKVSTKDFCLFDRARFEKTDSILSSVLQEYTQKEENYLEVIKANLSVFFIELARNRTDRKIPLSQTNTYLHQRLDEFIELLETHIASLKSVSQYADLLHISAYQLNSITKTTLGKTGSDLINDHIILESKRYLLATSNQVSQIAYHLGYDDVSYFIRFFKKHTGYSPEAFRNNFK